MPVRELALIYPTRPPDGPGNNLRSGSRSSTRLAGWVLTRSSTSRRPGAGRALRRPGRRARPDPGSAPGPGEAPRGSGCEDFAEVGSVVVAAVADGVGPRGRLSRTRRATRAIRRPPRPRGDCPRVGWRAGLRPLDFGQSPGRADCRGGRADPIRDGRYLKIGPTPRPSVAGDAGRPRAGARPRGDGAQATGLAARDVIMVGCPSGRCPAPSRGRRTCRGWELTGSLDR